MKFKKFDFVVMKNRERDLATVVDVTPGSPFVRVRFFESSYDEAVVMNDRLEVPTPADFYRGLEILKRKFSEQLEAQEARR